MAKSNWYRCVQQFKRELAQKNRFRARQKPVRAESVIYVQGELSTEALARLRKAGATIIRRDADATPRR
jgi:hypothetical protein